jgi:hypothetical protein
MPYFTLNRNYALSTTKGHSINFKKGEKTWVPQAIITEALAIGAVPETPIDVLPPEEQKLAALTTDERKQKMFAAFEKLILRSGRSDFSASGHPNPKRLEEITGFETDQKEREALWTAYHTLKQEEADQK